MRVAYLVLAHTDPRHIARLVTKLTQPDWAHVFLHVDGKIDEAPFRGMIGDNPRVTFVSDRITLTWAGFSAVKAMIRLFSSAMTFGQFDRFVVLQGLDYPLWSNSRIHKFFVDHSRVEYIRAFNASRDPSLRAQHKYTYFWDFDSPGFAARIGRGLNALLLKMKIRFKVKPGYIVEGGLRYDIFQGWAHISLTHRAVGLLLDFHDLHPGFNRYFRSVYAPDESYFHTIIHNSILAGEVPEVPKVTNADHFSKLNLTYFEYPDRVRVFRHSSEFELLRNSGYMFARKMDSKSEELLDFIDAQHEGEDGIESRE